MKKIKKYLLELLDDRFRSNFILLSLSFILVDTIFKLLSNFPLVSYSTLRIILSSLLISLFISPLSQLCNKRIIKNIINSTILFISSFYAWLQLGFMNYLGVYISFNTSSQLGAVKDYFFDYLSSFKIEYYLIFIPFIIYIVYLIILAKTKPYIKLIINKKNFEIPFILILLIFLYYGTINWEFMQNKYQTVSNKDLFKYVNNPSLVIREYGTNMYAILDLKSYLFPQNQDVVIYNNKVMNNKGNEINKDKRIVSDDLEKINNEEKEAKYININNYFLSRKVTDYNEYSGIFKGKDVYVILMESVNDAIINKEFFPNFYKLYNEGWSFENSFSPRNSCATGNNEFSSMTSLYSLYNACTSNIYVNNTYYHAIFNLFNNAGYTTNSAHNFTEWYYKRPTIHKNMGSQTFYNAGSLGIKTAGYYGEWPSDIDLMNNILDINEKIKGKHMTYLTTVTSHQPYSSSSTYGDLYKDEFKKYGYSTSASRYLSKLKVVDEALGVLINRLEESNKLDDTVIVLLADHYPYGLNKSVIKELLNYDLEDYNIERTPFVIYNSEMEAKKFDKYTSYINLVPTIANLMGLEYDPRLYFGEDLFSEDYESIVIFADGSWKNEKAFYNAATGNLKMYVENAYTDEEIKEITHDVDLKIRMSNNAIKMNYFNYLENRINEINEEENEQDNNSGISS